MSEPVSEERLRNTLAWAEARVGQLSGAEVIVAACNEALAARDRLNQWQSIETAPKGGKWILLWWPAITDAPFAGYFHQRWRMCSGDEWPGIDDPTHWQPLPSPPQPDAGHQEGG